MAAIEDRTTLTKIELYRNIYGGNFYEDYIFKVLSSAIKVRRINVVGNNLSASIFSFIYYFFVTKTLRKNDLMLNLQTIPFFSFFAKNTIVIVHHIDWSEGKWYSKLYQQICFLLLSLFKNRWQKIVVVSKYWEAFLKKRGFKNISIIYNSFPVDSFRSLGKLPANFKTKHRLSSLPIIYLGNPQNGKGWKTVYQQLRDLNFQFVVTGNTEGRFKSEERLIHLNLKYSEYLRLLKSSSCAILFSKFQEGWNRTAHESLLVGTPVIGSGKGGMQELLEMSGQEICHDILELKYVLRRVLENREHYAQLGQKFSKQFNEEYFEGSWLSLFKSIDHLVEYQ